MKKLLFATAGLAALSLFAAPAQAQEGYVGGSYVSQDFGAADAKGWQIDGAVALDTGTAFGVAVDAAVGDNDLPGSDSTVNIGGHLFGKGATALYGGFVDYTDGGNASAWAFGGEGQVNFTGFTLAGSAGWVNFNDSVYEDGWGAGAEARVFPTDNIRLSGNVGYTDLSGVTAAFDDSVLTFGVGGEWQPLSIPVSFVADYAHSEFDRANGEADAFKIGARYNFGGSLKSRNDSGADLIGAKFLGGAF